MAFHVACPITCRRICDCELGFPRELRAEKARGHFLDEISALEEFLADPWLLRVGGGEDTDTVRVPVPRVVVPTPYQHQAQAAAAVAAEGGGEGEESAKRAALQRQALEASIAAEDYVRRLEAGGDADLLGEGAALAAEDQGSSVVKVICRICFSGEKEGSNKALKMLPCRICNKKYHMSCLKSWAKNRDLFHWNSWACPSCRICEVCRRAGDPNKLMYCRRCDGAYHCYCQQPPHKNVGHGPYVCPKHTRCHSCGSSVPGSGPSTRWFLGYTCCDACGRLFVKGNYCPVCLKVYRDSETTPMVCCDVCERWVHCGCDGISDEKYQQFQANENLQYQCAACRGDCYQVKDIDDAVRELWRRKDEADHELMASLRASAALPSQDETSASPNSDDNQCGPVVLKNDYGKPLKFSVKNSKENERSISKNLSPNKNYANKKAFHIKFVTRPEGSYQHSERQKDETPPDGIFRDQKPNVTNSYMNDGPESLLSSRSTSLDKNGLKSSVNQSERNKYSPVKEIGDNNAGRFSKVKSENNNLPGLQLKECSARTASKKEIVKGTKLVIHLGSKNRNVSSSPRSETSSCHKEQDLAASYYGSEDTSQLKARDHETHMHESCTTIKRDEKGAKFDNASQTRSSKHGDRDKNVIKLGKVSDVQKKSNGNIAEESELVATCATSPISTRTVGEATPWNDSEVVIPRKKRHSVGPSVNQENDTGHQASRLQFVSGASFDPKPLLKLKFKNPYFEQRSSWVPRGQEESPIKGQRSKRKRPSELEKINASAEEDDSSASQLNHQENPLTDEVMDANWILQKLGKDAIGKRVEVYQPSDRSWCEGVVSNVTIQGGKGTTPSSLLVHLDDGRRTTLELGKQAVRFVSHKQAKKARK